MSQGLPRPPALHPTLQAMVDSAAGLPPMQTIPLRTLRAGPLFG